MSLLAILISLILEKLLPPMHDLRSLTWIEPYQQWIHTRLTGQGIISLLIIVFLPLIGIATVQYLLDDLLIFPGFIFSIIVLTYCLGPKNNRRLAHEYLDAEERGDNAEYILQDIVSRTTSAPLPEDKPSRARALIECVLIQTHEQLLAILFWFVVLGPVGAALYRLTVELQQAEQHSDKATDTETDDTEFRAAVTRLHYLLAWIPGHLTALSYAVMGSFVHALHAWQNAPHEETDTNDDTNPHSHRLLLRIGQAALQFDNHPPQDDTQYNDAIREASGLCGRSLVAWITVLALMTLAGWAS